MKLFYYPEGRLRLTAEDRSYLEVKAVWASPMTYPTQYLALVDGKGKEIKMYKDPQDEMSAEMWEVVKNELERTYLNGVIHKILESKTVFGSTYWTVITDRGRKEFVTQSLQENAQWMGPKHLLVTDVDGNRFEIPDIDALDTASRKNLDLTV